MIILYGTVHDEMIELMCSRLNSLSYQYILIDPFSDMHISFTYKNIFGKKIEGKIVSNNKAVKIEDITGIYARFAFVKNKIKDLSQLESEVIKNERNSLFINFIDNFHGLVLNRVGISAGNDSKLYQQKIISSSGFLTPKTLVTTLPSEIKKFYDSCNEKVIYKSLSGIRSIVTRFQPADIRKLSSLKNCPVQFQELIEGTDIRVHTVGKKIFATAIDSDSVDYRYAKHTRPDKFYEYELPKKISQSCLGLSRKMGFEIAGIDLKRTSDGKFYCFEVNPSPAFISYERITGQPISIEVAHFLKKGKD